MLLQWLQLHMEHAQVKTLIHKSTHVSPFWTDILNVFVHFPSLFKLILKDVINELDAYLLICNLNKDVCSYVREPWLTLQTLFWNFPLSDV